MPDLDPLPLDVITTELRSFADLTERRLSGVARVVREGREDFGLVEGVAVEPSAVGAVPVWWMHSSQDLTVGLGVGAGWVLPRSAQGVKTLVDVVNAAVAGHVEVASSRAGTKFRVRTSDGLERVDEVESAGGLLRLLGRGRPNWELAAPYGVA